SGGSDRALKKRGSWIRSSVETHGVRTTQTAASFSWGLCSARKVEPLPPSHRHSDQLGSPLGARGCAVAGAPREQQRLASGFGAGAAFFRQQDEAAACRGADPLQQHVPDSRFTCEQRHGPEPAARQLPDVEKQSEASSEVIANQSRQTKRSVRPR
ncbi:MAG: hypothetical protein AB7O38_18495, partial [Pirellulaceae bacterium]